MRAVDDVTQFADLATAKQYLNRAAELLRACGEPVLAMRAEGMASTVDMVVVEARCTAVTA